ncbi:polyphosphate kinase 2 [Vibrio sp. B172a]|uniref:polyphosphate kinase 2 n=1 Tax=Vibrio sp. B172a TaxID=2835790 RepID=UPI00255461AD|nr:polyphosphate kinase 2 [Vibrio sp. B172a]MDK9780980.1 polyphosphate kinase 2 [Vibrio sp. B172a]
MAKLKKKEYEEALEQLQIELVKLQEWVKHKGLKVVVLFEGRDAAGKGGTIKRITEKLNPRVCRIAALPAPTEKEKTQWYFQRYVAHLPAAGEIVLFDRSWYNRAGVEKVMGFCTPDQYEEQEKRFLERINTPIKRWKFSPMDLESRNRWAEYSEAKDKMFAYTDTKHCPWWVVPSDDKKKARLNCISHLLSQVEYEELEHPVIELPELNKEGYVRAPIDDQTFVPDKY